ncbi:MAG: lysozyme family protein [Enterococcus sp.]
MKVFVRSLKIIGIIFFTGVILAGLFWGVRNYQILKDVHQYDNQVAELTQAKELEEYQRLVSAIIMTESKGQGVDLMQSSESAYGEIEQITSQKESLTQGISYLSQALELADAAGCDVWTAVQAYNFGLDYIDYVKEHGQKNTIKLAQTYSKEVLAPILGNSELNQYRYWNPHAVAYNGGYLYQNGGNFFYAQIVKNNQEKLKITEFLF